MRSRKNPSAQKEEVGLWDERLPRNDDKGHQQAYGSPQRILPCAWRVQHTLMHDKIFPIHFALIKIDKSMEIIRMHYTIIGLYCEYQNQCLVQRTASGYGIFFLQILPAKV